MSEQGLHYLASIMWIFLLFWFWMLTFCQRFTRRAPATETRINVDSAMWSFWQSRLFTASLKVLFRIINLPLPYCWLADLPTSFHYCKYLPRCQSALRSTRRAYEEKQRKQRKRCEERDVGCLVGVGGVGGGKVGEISDWSERKEGEKRWEENRESEPALLLLLLLSVSQVAWRCANLGRDRA